MTRELERDIEKYFVEQLKKRGMLTIKLSMAGFRGTSGWPDRLVIDPNKKYEGLPSYHFVELKTSTGKLTKKQELRLNQLHHAGCNTYTLYGMDQVKQWLKEL